MKNDSQVSSWNGWVGFAAIMLYLSGFFDLIAGIVALFRNTIYVAGAETIISLDFTQLGWLHILSAIILMTAASSLVMGKTYGRIIAVLAAIASAAANMVFIPYYPIWSILIIVINVLVIYAVVVHAGELKEKN